MARNWRMFRQHEARSQWEAGRTEHIQKRKERVKNAQAEEDDLAPILAAIYGAFLFRQKQGSK